MIVCNHCKTKNDDSAVFCMHCGTRLSNDASHDERQTSNNCPTNNGEVSTSVESLKKIKLSRSIQTEMVQKHEDKSKNATRFDNDGKQKPSNTIVRTDKTETKANMNKKFVHICYTLIIVVLVIISISQYAEINRLNSLVSELPHNKEQMKNEQTTQKNELASARNEISSKNEQSSLMKNKDTQRSDSNNEYEANKNFIIESIDIKDSNANYGEIIFSKCTYLKVRVKLLSKIDCIGNLYVKFFSPEGLSTNTDSPPGYSYLQRVQFTKDQINTVEFEGWCSDKKDFWSEGDYKIEIYYNYKWIGSKDFYIFP